MLCHFSSAYLRYVPCSNLLLQGNFSCSFCLAWILCAALFLARNLRLRFMCKCVVRDCCRAKREVSLFCRQSLEALEHGFSHHECGTCRRLLYPEVEFKG